MFALGCSAKRERPAPTTDAATAISSDALRDPRQGEKLDASVEASAACPPIDPAKVAPFTCEGQPDWLPALPPIVDQDKSLSRFWDALARAARGLATDHVRIGFYGDSNHTADAMTGFMRRKLQARYGEGGHGFVALAHPWDWYSHNDVHHDGTWKSFKWATTSTNRVADGHYGFANIGSECGAAGASAWVSTEPQPNAPVGWTASRFDVYYAKRPGGGRFDVLLDGEKQKTIDTAADQWEPAFERIDTTDAKHEVKVVIGGHGPVRLYGVVLERPKPGIQVDGLGTGSLNFEQMTLPKPETRKPQLQRRNYDLVMIALGTNCFNVPANNEKHVKEFIDAIRDAIPGVPFLFLTPPDSIEEGVTYADPHIVALSKSIPKMAAANKSASWDYFAAMGGPKSINTFAQKNLANPDRIHLKKPAHELMADRFLCAMSASFGAYLKEHPDAGCAK